METEVWGQEALDIVVPAYIRFDRQGLGEMQLIAIGASSDYRVEKRNGVSVLEFSWSGFDEMETTSGRAWARIDGDTMRGKLFIHQGRSGWRGCAHGAFRGAVECEGHVLLSDLQARLARQDL